MKIVVQDTWTEEDDVELLEYLDKKAVILDSSSILNEPISELEVIFCDTKILKSYLNANAPNYALPDPYPSYFKSLYKRNIRKTTMQEIKSGSLPLPYFVRPASHDKSFAQVVMDKYDVMYMHSLPIDDDYAVYVCNIVEFVNEFRIFIADSAIYAIVESTEFTVAAEKSECKPPVDFLQQVIQQNECKFCVVDIGMTKSKEWMIVEVNPPFSLSSYDLPIESYVQYCKNAFAFIKQL